MRRLREIGNMNANYLMVWVVSVVVRPVLNSYSGTHANQWLRYDPEYDCHGERTCQHLSGSMTLGVVDES